ncbi:hypothetical protein FGB62_2g09 [Gracilaria domingensis]|nr:hypothetical protein FGB62_2g09 [Gracilaria domingensis]
MRATRRWATAGEIKAIVFRVSASVAVAVAVVVAVAAAVAAAVAGGGADDGEEAGRSYPRPCALVLRRYSAVADEGGRTFCASAARSSARWRVCG